MELDQFWYIAAQSKDVGKDKPFATKILNEWVVIFRDESGEAQALQDRCAHRCAQLSKGTVKNGELSCPYHGWTYRGDGNVTHVPSEGPRRAMNTKNTSRKTRNFQVLEAQDYIYVCLSEKPVVLPPFSIPGFRLPGWGSIRVINRFKNNVTNCVENFVDIPHTVSVHPKIFRNTKEEKFGATVKRVSGSVHVRYHQERANLGYFSWFLNPKNVEMLHTDEFHMPNITTVCYSAGETRTFHITSQSIPVTDDETLVYTDVTYAYGRWTQFAGPFVRRIAQKIIDQDLVILENQMHGIKKYGTQFMNSEADIIHVMIESIRKELENKKDPRELSEKEYTIEFWV